MKIVSLSFEDGKTIPAKYAYKGVSGGKNVSPHLSWSDVPPDVKSFALSMVDPHPVARNWVHWLVINIPTKETELVEGASGKKMPPNSRELYNSYGELGYGGPQPPKGSGPHPYVITVYALNVEKLNLNINTNLETFTNILESKIITTAKITGIFER